MIIDFHLKKTSRICSVWKSGRLDCLSTCQLSSHRTGKVGGDIKDQDQLPSNYKIMIESSMEYRHHECVNDMKSDGTAEELTEIKKISKKRKKRNKDGGMVILRLYFDDSSNKLKPLLIFDLNKVLVWRRSKTNFFVIRPHAIEVNFCCRIIICASVFISKVCSV